MYRVIFSHPIEGYGFLESDKYETIVRYLLALKRNQKEVVCIIYSSLKLFIYKSANFDLHRSSIESFLFECNQVGMFSEC